MGFTFLPLPPLSRAVCLKWYLFLFATAHRDCCLDILPSWHPDRYDTDAFGQKSEPVCYMPLRPYDACSASESPQCPAGEIERARGPQMNSEKRAGISAMILLPFLRFKCSHRHGFFPPFCPLFFPFPSTLGWFPVSSLVAGSLGSWVFVSWKRSAQASDQPLLVLRRI